MAVTNERGWVLNFEATDEQLLAFGLSQNILDVSRLPWLRPGVSGDFERQGLDLAYVKSINEAKDRVALAALAINNPGVKVLWYPPHISQSEAFIGMVRHD